MKLPIVGSKTPFARRPGQPTWAARGIYPLNMNLNSLKLARPLALGTAFAFATTVLFAADAKTEKKAEKKAAAPAVKPGLIQDDFPFLKACIGAKFPGKNDANKGIAIRLGTNAAMCFDQDLLRWSAGWTGGFVSTKGVTFDGSHGGHPELIGEQQFGLRVQPGWADASGSFKDPRKEPYGPLPRAWGRVSSLQVHGMEVTISYEVLGTPIKERAEIVERDGVTAFVRNISLGKNAKELLAAVCEVEGAQGKVEGNQATLTAANGQVTVVALSGAPKGAKLELVDGARVLLRIPAGAGAGAFKLAIARTDAAGAGKVAALAQGAPRFNDTAKAGKAHWPEAVVTNGVLAASSTPDGAYVQDVITPPVPNPWNRRVRFGGMDFFADGKRAALSTWDGDVWVVSGIDDKLDKLTWKRFASGGFETLGLKIVDDVIYTSGRDQITRYRDLDGDGSADVYETFNDDITSSPGFHEFTFDLHTDKEGNFYMAKAGPVKGGGRGFGGGGGNGEISEHAGCLMKVDKYGHKLEVVATGLRAPTGIGVGPNGEITTGDNEGTWVPMCPINWVKPGGFYGVEDLSHGRDVKTFRQPLCWMAKSWDNSGGGQAWVTSTKWGPFSGELLHCSYGQSSIYLVLKEFIGDQPQGGIVKIPVKLTSSAMRPRFNPVDGQLYNAGLRGWQSNAAKEGGFDRIRYTGKSVVSIAKLNVTKAGVALTFTQPLDKTAAEDVQNYSGERWNYLRTSNYGSPEFSVENPEKKGHDKLDITAAKLSADGKTVTLAITALKPVNQQLLKFQLKTAGGVEFKQDVLHTINVIP
jgi:glucose/arabinose dehydrogenase